MKWFWTTLHFFSLTFLGPLPSLSPRELRTSGLVVGVKLTGLGLGTKAVRLQKEELCLSLT